MEGEAEAEGEEAAEGGCETGPGQRPPPGAVPDPAQQTEGVQVGDSSRALTEGRPSVTVCCVPGNRSCGAAGSTSRRFRRCSRE